MSPTIIALISAAIGGTGIKLLEAYLLPKVKQADVATEIRDELRMDLGGCRSENKALKREIDFWKKTYFALIELLYKNHIEVPDKYMQPYRDDPSTPDIPPRN